MACPTKEAVDTVELAAVTAVLESDTLVAAAAAAAAAEDIGIDVGNPASSSRTRQGKGRGDLLADAPCFPTSEAKSRLEGDSPHLAVPLQPATPVGLLVGP